MEKTQETKNIKPISEKSYVIKTKRPNGSIRIQTFNMDPSETINEDPAKSDINQIIKNYSKTGQWPLSSKQLIYDEEGQIPRVADLLEASQLVKDASEKFAALPSKIRERFGNSPELLISFLNSPENLQEAIDLGLLPKRDEPNDAIPAQDPPKPS